MAVDINTASAEKVLQRARGIGIELTEEHWKAIRFLFDDFRVRGETPNLRRVAVVGGVPIKRLLQLFPGEPGRKMAYIAGLPAPRWCA
ncbi:MAG TPA: TusE/DsrC/DsvC family sulfur relay protein [Candidatus Limnocylindrales bacterium]|nr:TusE/DsrC/DsvC family sulfur relay protein [Candidatus Limnocylindrales bacterium]